MEDKVFITSDLPLAAYLVINGLNLQKARKMSGGKFEFVLKDPPIVTGKQFCFSCTVGTQKEC